MRIVSFFSSATELLYALGLGRCVVGRSEHCDYPASVRQKPVIVRSRVRSAHLSSRGIEEAVQQLRRRSEHQYWIDVALLKRLKPDLVVTQELCSVCAASHPEVSEAIHRLPQVPRLVSVSGRNFAQCLDAVRILGRETGHQRQADFLIRRMQRSIQTIQHRLKKVSERPRVWCVEWLDPLMVAGHWTPDMVAMAGGIDGLGRAAQDSRRVSWEVVRQYDPEVIVVMPCSFSIARTVRESPLLSQLPGWSNLKAVKAHRVFAVNGAFFHRSGPRLLTGLKIMAALFHPERFPKPLVSHARKLLSK